MAEVDLEDLQGDLFNRGFPKFHEVYYFFHIVTGKEKEFSQKLKVLVEGNRISSLRKVLDDWKEVDAVAQKNRDNKYDPDKMEIVSTLNTLIAFSKSGLDKIQTGLTSAGRPSLNLRNLKLSDPIFDVGMREDGPDNLNDPPVDNWDPLFNKTTIHGLLKVAGSSPENTNTELEDIKEILGHKTNVIKDIDGDSPPTTSPSKLEGHTRPGKGHGREHFGFRDGLSQPLLIGINKPEDLEKDPFMQTNQNIITVTSKPPGTQDGIEADPKRRPPWMINGSFMAFRKLEQNVQKWINLVENFAAAGCNDADHCGAKLMGRWKSGAPVAIFPNADPGTGFDNTFRYKGVSKFNCPLGAHIRKVHPRTEADSVKMARMIRNGIPYGSEFEEHPEEKRGLLFACYQSSLENGFQFVQRAWSNEHRFPTSQTGYDALIGQAKDEGMLSITLHSHDETNLDPGLGQFEKSTTMKGGEYFFVPSISALKDTLGCD